VTLETLPDYLRPGLDLVFVGINPGWLSAQRGQYFANPRNRFWPAFNAAAMAPVPLTPETGHRCLEFGIGFTDVVKRPTHSMSELKPAEFAEGAAMLHSKLLQHRPRVVCFNGLSGFKNYARRALPRLPEPVLGTQAATIGASRVYVLPSTSPANAAVSLERIVEGMRDLKALIDRTKAG
jgi:TDG/mug DNA glycosylase family protein